MIWRVGIAVLLTAVISLIALSAPRAQFNGCPAGFCSLPSTGGGGGYTGPLDVVGSAQLFYSVRSPTAAYATGSNKTITTVTRASDSHVCDFLIDTSGNLGNTTNCTPSGDNGTIPFTWCNSTTCQINTALDTSGNGFNAVNTGGNRPTLKTTSSPFTGYSTSFSFSNGSTQYFQTSSSSAFNSLSFTLIAWVNPTSTSGQLGIMGGQAATPAFRINGGKPELLSALTNNLCITSSATISASTWTQVAVTWSNTSPTCVFYINGASVATTTTGATQTFSGNPTPWIVGGDDGDPTWDGQIAEAMVYNSALNSTQITNIYNNATSNP